MKTLVCSLVLLAPALDAASLPGDIASKLDACNVVWTERGASSADSMPLGNGDIGLNVWTEASGDIVFYISKTDAWTEAVTRPLGLGKIGRVRVSFSPNPFASGDIRQELNLREGEITISGGGTHVRIRVDANDPFVRVEAESKTAFTTTVQLDPWRTAEEGFGTKAASDDPSAGDGREKISPDVVLPPEKNRLTWYHRNGATGEAAVKDLTFGATLWGKDFRPGKGNSLVSSSPATSAHFDIAALTAITPTAEDWVRRIDELSTRLAKADPETSRAAHRAWWEDFWSRSWIFVDGDADANRVTQGYVLQRFITACAGRGAYPVKFNGSIFTVDNPALDRGRDKATGKSVILPVTADYRAWGGQYWFQNTRPMYWPRLAAGDFDIMRPLFRMYSEIAKANAPKVREFYNHDGSYIAETAPFWGGIPNIKPGEAGSYTKHYFTPVLELTAMMLDYYAYTGNETFVGETLLPLANSGLTFFSQHFPRDPSGRLLLDPDNSIEMFWTVRNPLPDLAGLHWVLARLQELPNHLTTSEMRAKWKKLADELPPVPTGERNGERMLLPAEDGQELKPRNSENPELYAVYPFRLYGLGKPDIDLALNAYKVRLNKRSGCWHQDPVQSAYLGLTADAKAGVTKCLTNRDKRLRFPAFWEKGHDYEPDQDNGGNGELALQRMLLQCEGREIRLLPAWPAGWNADFQLRAPMNTTVRGTVRDGRVASLAVTPASRRADVILPPEN